MLKIKQQLILAALCVLTAALALYMRPNTMLSETRPVALEKIIPAQFGQWKEEKNQSAVVTPPDLEAVVNKLYSQVVQRTYINPQGLRIMLSIAYSPDQRDNNGRQVHKPEVCYPAQGFEIKSNKLIELETQFGTVPARQILATLGERIEPMLYWTTVGHEIASSGEDFKLKQFKYGLQRIVADGLIFRVSSINPEMDQAKSHQVEFINDLLSSLSAEDRKILGFN